jgi:ferredoxin
MRFKGSRSSFKEVARRLLPSDGSFDLCLSCGLCSSGCPASGLADMDPRKFLRLASLGQDEIIATTPWVWMCTLCRRCTHLCPMHIDIPALVYHARTCWPREKRPKGIVGSCDQALATGTASAMGTRPEDFRFVVEDVLAEVRENQPGQENLAAPVNRRGAYYFLNQNSREPVTEPDEMVPLWKILDYVGADWTYGTLGWAAENYCMFAADDAGWETLVRRKVAAVQELGCKVWLNTE